MKRTRAILGSTIVLYFVIGFEILIMISPFAGFFYAIFNPFLLKIAGHPATRWLSSFFLPHMVIPPDGALVFVRIMGSVLLVCGVGLFFFCAAHIYTSKFLKKGPVTGGLYRFIRHPQYLALAAAGSGLAILWPRFLVVLLWCLMVLVYYLLAHDEERRMLAAHQATYRPYMEQTGMFLPRALEDRLLPRSNAGRAVAFMLMAAFVIGGAFGFRAYTVRHLTLWSKGNLTAVAILPEDGFKMDHRMADILNLDGIASRLDPDSRYLAFVMPRNYVMQGLVADTGGAWRLYKHHHTISMITDWIFHPFRHLRQGHQMERNGHGHHNGTMSGPIRDASPDATGVTRRIVFLVIEDVPVRTPYDAFSIGARRVPRFMADVEFHNLELLSARDLPERTGWGRVPTPVF